MDNSPLSFTAASPLFQCWLAVARVLCISGTLDPTDATVAPESRTASRATGRGAGLRPTEHAGPGLLLPRTTTWWLSEPRVSVLRKAPSCGSKTEKARARPRAFELDRTPHVSTSPRKTEAAAGAVPIRPIMGYGFAASCIASWGAPLRLPRRTECAWEGNRQAAAYEGE